MNPSDQLFKTLNSTVKSYPEGIVPVPTKRLKKGTAFFPAGDGIYKENKTPIKEHYPIMILGQDYDNEKNFGIVLDSKHQSEVTNGNKTWINLQKVFGDNMLSNCFFTNAIMGLRINDTKNTGRSKAFLLKNDAFLKQNQEFFKIQLDVAKPDLVIGLGRFMPKFISGCFKEFSELANVESFKQFDSDYGKYRNGIVLNHNGRLIKMIFITHPALYFRCVIDRKGGLKYEQELIEKALSHVKK
jgi:hypothetical protein